MEQEEEPENTTIYVQGLSETVTAEELVEFFKNCGEVKVREVVYLSHLTH